MRSPFDSSAVRTLIFASIALYGVSRGVSTLTRSTVDTAPREPQRDYLAEVQGRMRPEAQLSPVQIRHLQAMTAASAAETPTSPSTALPSPTINPGPSPGTPASQHQWNAIMDLAQEQNAATHHLEGLLRGLGTPRN